MEQVQEQTQSQAQNEPSPEEVLEEVVKAMQEQAEDAELSLMEKLSDLDDNMISKLEESSVETPQEQPIEPESQAQPEPEPLENVKPFDKSGSTEAAQPHEPPQDAPPSEETSTEVSSPQPSPYELLDQDPVLKQLSQMSEEERVAWATQAGSAGIAKLLQLQKIETMIMIEQAKTEAVRPTLDAIIESWADRNADLLADQKLKDIARGLELKYLADKGLTSYDQLSVPELNEMLSYIESTLRSISAIQSQTQKQTETKPQTKQEQSQRTNVSVGDITGGTPPQNSELEILERISKDPLKLEEAISKLPPSKLDDLLAQIQ